MAIFGCLGYPLADQPAMDPLIGRMRVAFNALRDFRFDRLSKNPLGTRAQHLAPHVASIKDWKVDRGTATLTHGGVRLRLTSNRQTRSNPEYAAFFKIPHRQDSLNLALSGRIRREALCAKNEWQLREPF